MVIRSNMIAAFANRQLNINEKSKARSTERLSSGYRVNRAADDAAGLSISEKMRAQIRGLNQGARNVQDGISFCNTAEGALQEVHAVLGRIKELSVQAANDTYITADRITINDEIIALKKEINRISAQTEFNTYNIFSAPFEVNFSGDVYAVQIFDATNSDPADPDSYGGIIVTSNLGQDTRVSWNTINPGMVSKDANGNTVFNAGTYTYNTGLCDLEIECKNGSKPPEIKVSFPVEGTDDGISVAGQEIGWEDILNEEDDTILNHIGEGGTYHFNIGNGVGSFYVKGFSSLDNIKNGINTCNKKYSRKYINEYNGYYKAQAIDIKDTGSRLRITNEFAKNLADKTDLDIRLKADETGIWIVSINNDGSDGAEFKNSKKTWEELGITSWDSKNDISDTKVYHYIYKSDDNDNSDYNIQFNFTLLDETSKESVIDGINNATIDDRHISTNDEYGFTFTKGNGVESGVLKKSSCGISIYDEIALGRDFDKKEDQFATTKLEYDKDSDSFQINFKKDGNTVASLKSVSVTSMDTIKNNAEPYENYLVARQVQKLLSGNTNPSYPSLGEVIGESNITPNSQVVLDSSKMNTTQKLNGTYSLATMDFSGLGKDYQLYDLLGMGFNSTCATCSNHYSVMFVYGDTDKVASNGTGYTMSNDGNSNYTLQIDLKQMLEKGINDGASFVNAIVDVIDESRFDFHFQQYAADGAKLYVCDNRKRALGSFDTKPYEIDKCTVDISTTGAGNIDLQYVYNLKDDLDPLAEKIKDSNGIYVEDDNGKLVLYDANNTSMQNKDRYNIQITNNITSWEECYDKIMGHIADQSEITLNSKDYSYVGYHADENPNSATVSTFDFHIEDEKGFWIQAGANTGQGIILKWDNFSTYTLGIGNGNTLTQKSSEKLISDADKASEEISYMRSVFGAYTNRMEHMYSIDTNTSENLQAAESKIRDANMAEAMVTFTSEDILSQAAQAMLAQANRMRDGILQLLQ